MFSELSPYGGSIGRRPTEGRRDAEVELSVSDAVHRRLQEQARRQRITAPALVHGLISALRANWPSSATRPEESASERRRRDRHFQRVCEEIGKAHPDFRASDNGPREVMYNPNAHR